MKKVSGFLLLSSGLLIAAVTFNSCSKNSDPALPPIGGYNNSDEVGAANLVAYWPLDGSGNESKTNTAPTSSVGASYVTPGVKGQALSLLNGYLYYGAQLGTLVSNQGFTISAWVQVTNTGGLTGTPYQYFQSAIPGQLFGNVNCLIEAGQYNFASDTMSVKSIYKDLNGGTQDNINNYGDIDVDYKVVKAAGTSKWVNIVTTYNPAGGTGAESIFRVYANGVLVSNKKFENRGVSSFKFYTPSEVIIGGWYNNIPGKTVSADTWTTPFNGKIDEIRVWSKLLAEADITAVYNLGVAGR